MSSFPPWRRPACPFARKSTARSTSISAGNWQVFLAARRDVEGDQFLDAEYGLGYEDECIGISLAYRRKYTADPLLGVPPSTSIIMRLSFKTR